MMDIFKVLQKPWLIWVHMNSNFKYRETTPEELFTNAYTEDVYESEHFRTDTKQLRVILYTKY